MKNAKWMGWMAAAMMLGAVAESWATETNGFWARLSIPDPLVKGKISENCFVEYGNSGTTDIPSPVLQISMNGDGTLGYIGGLSGLKTLQFVAAGESENAGVLRPGATRRIQFALGAGRDNRTSLYVLADSDVAPEPWESMTQYLADISIAATRVGLRGQDATSFKSVYDLAKDCFLNVELPSVHGIIATTGGVIPIPLTLVLKDIATSNEWFAITDNELFCFSGVSNGVYTLCCDSIPLLSAPGEIVVDDADVNVGTIAIKDEVGIAVTVQGETERSHYLMLLENSEVKSDAFFGDEKGRFFGLTNGVHGISVFDEDGILLRTVKVCFTGQLENVTISLGGKSSVTVQLPNSLDGCECKIAVMRDDEIFSTQTGIVASELIFNELPDGDYLFWIDNSVSGNGYVAHLDIDSQMQNKYIVEYDERGVLNSGAGAGRSLASQNNPMMARKSGSVFDNPEEKYQQLSETYRRLASVPINQPTGKFKCTHNMSQYAKRQAALEALRKRRMHVECQYWEYRTLDAKAAVAMWNVPIVTAQTLATAYFGRLGLPWVGVGISAIIEVAKQYSAGEVSLWGASMQINEIIKQSGHVVKATKIIGFLDKAKLVAEIDFAAAQRAKATMELNTALDVFSVVLSRYESTIDGLSNYAECCDQVIPPIPSRKPTFDEKTPEVWDGRQQAWNQDLVLVIDSTSSMNSAIQSAKTSARRIVQTVLGDGGRSGNRIAVVEYRDKGDAFVYRARSKFTSNASTAISAINGITVDGGGDTPEALYATLRAVAEGLAGEWRNVNKNIIVMTDAPPHDPDLITGDTKASIKQLLAKRNIRRSAQGARQGAKATESEDDFHVHFIYLDSGASTADIYRELADATGGTCQSGVNPDDAADAIMDALETIADWDPDVEMVDIRVTPRWPWNGLVDLDFAFEPTVEGTKATFAVSGVDGDLGTEVEAKTLTGAYRNLTGGTYRVTWDLGADAPGFHSSAFTVQMDATIDPLPAPVVEIESLSAENGVLLEWNHVEPAESYAVFRATDSAGTDAVEIGTVQANPNAPQSFQDAEAPHGQTVWYAVKPVAWKLDASRSSWVSARRNMRPPTDVSATDGSLVDGVLVTWTPTPGTVLSRVYRCLRGDDAVTAVDNAINFEGEIPIAETHESSWFDNTAVPGKDYIYTVSCVSAEGANSTLLFVMPSPSLCAVRREGLLPRNYFFFCFDSGWRNMEAPVITSATRTNWKEYGYPKGARLIWGDKQYLCYSKFSISWDAVEGALSYLVEHWPVDDSSATNSVIVTECTFETTDLRTTPYSERYPPARTFRVTPISDHQGLSSETTVE